MKNRDGSKVLLQHRVAEETRQQFKEYCSVWHMRKGDALERAVSLLTDPNLTDPDLYQRRLDGILRQTERLAEQHDRMSESLDLLTEFVRAFALFVMTHLGRVDALELADAHGRATKSYTEIITYIGRRLESEERFSDELPITDLGTPSGVGEEEKSERQEHDL